MVVSLAKSGSGALQTLILRRKELAIFSSPDIMGMNNGVWLDCLPL